MSLAFRMGLERVRPAACKTLTSKHHLTNVITGFYPPCPRSGPMMPYHLWAFVFALSLVMMTIYPTLIAPIFNKFDPLPEVTHGLKIQDCACLGNSIVRMFDQGSGA